MRLVRIILLVALASLAGRDLSQAQQAWGLNEQQRKQSLFPVDYAVFNSSEQGLVRLEVFYQIYNAVLNFYRLDTLYAADYELSINVYGDEDRLMDSYTQDKRVFVESEIRAKSIYDYRTNQVNFELEPGKYEVKLVLSDPNSAESVTQDFKVKLEYHHEKYPRLSDIQLVQSVASAGEQETKFDKGGYTLVPSVSHRYGTSDALTLYYYFEIYQGREDSDSVLVETSLRHATKGMLYRDSLTVPFEDGVARQFREISMDKLRPGEFKLDINLQGPRDKRFDNKTKYFDLVWSERSMLLYDYESIINQLSIISLPGDLEELKQQETYEDRLAAFNMFWARRDPTPGTNENETKTEFYRRVQVANENFGYLRKSGWRTDRGRVYIVYGEPDQIDDYPFQPNSYPYQEWYYYREAKYRKFVFVDETGDGDYRLIYPYDGLGIGPEDRY
ncbi:MAG: GWxTD domain-containing protein [Candidatus Zixiibacteriota bacterium]